MKSTDTFLSITDTGDAPPLLTESPLLSDAIQYWRSIKNGETLPGRKDFDPVSIPQLLPYTNLVDVVLSADTHRFRHRLNGTELVERFGQDNKGRWFEDIYTSKHLAVQLQAYRTAVKEQIATLGTISMPLSSGSVMRYNRLIMPLSADGKSVDMLFIIFEFLKFDPEFINTLPLYQDAPLKAEE